MAKQKKRAAKKSGKKAKPKRPANKAAKKTAAKSSKAKGAVKPKAAVKSVKAKSALPISKPVLVPAPTKKLAQSSVKDEPKKSSLAIPKDPDLDEELNDEEVDLSGEGEMEEDIEEELNLDDEDEDVDYLEKSEELLDDSDDYRTH